jgi:FtsZ-binding cell division protein ZapB
VVVLNKFLATEGRINTLIDLIPQLQIDPGHLSEESSRLHQEVLSRVENAENPE